jgi:hypothetical protein
VGEVAALKVEVTTLRPKAKTGVSWGMGKGGVGMVNKN